MESCFFLYLECVLAKKSSKSNTIPSSLLHPIQINECPTRRTYNKNTLLLNSFEYLIEVIQKSWHP